MNGTELQNLLKTSDYDFLRNNEHLGSKIMFLTLGGSHAYGTNIATSDVDVRGVAMNRPSDLIGLSNFEQVVDNKTDTTVYGFNKLLGLLLNCNPNTIEMLGCRPETYVGVTEAGRMLLDNVDLFLSLKAAHSFGGYANQQLRRLEIALAKDRVSDPRKEAFALNSVLSVLHDFNNKNGTVPEGGMELFIGEGKTEGMESEILVNTHLEGFPLRSFKPMLEALGTTLGQYNSLGKRNTKKDDAHLDKHAMHLVRLYLMAFDILEKGKVVTYRENDREQLMAVRNGSYRKEDGTYDPAFFELVNEYEKRLKYDVKNSMLPKVPNYKKVEELAMEINRMALKGD